MRIEGVSEEVEIVRWGKCLGGKNEKYLSADGHISTWNTPQTSSVDYLIVRRMPPVCVWPRGVFNNGWIAEETAGTYWYSEKPVFEKWDACWGEPDDESICSVICSVIALLNPPVFRDDLPMEQRIQQVGPTFESKETVR